MSLDELEAISGVVNGLAMQGAIVDGINRYLREVLIPLGIVDEAKNLDFAGTEQNSLKHCIAEEITIAFLRRSQPTGA